MVTLVNMLHHFGEEKFSEVTLSMTQSPLTTRGHVEWTPSTCDGCLICVTGNSKWFVMLGVENLGGPERSC